MGVTVAAGGCKFLEVLPFIQGDFLLDDSVVNLYEKHALAIKVVVMNLLEFVAKEVK